jgi:hypothetical protein
MIDRSEVSRALAKVIAYRNCGKDILAEEWARTLVELLECASILNGGDKIAQYWVQYSKELAAKLQGGTK